MFVLQVLVGDWTGALEHSEHSEHKAFVLQVLVIGREHWEHKVFVLQVLVGDWTGALDGSTRSTKRLCCKCS